MKDNFSEQSQQYAQFRPLYPVAFFDFIMPLIKNKSCAWDCATGNGQIAGVLSGYFKTVYATDISQKQLDNAVLKDNIFYKQEAAEHTGFPDHFFDLVTVGQAVHWFHFDKFYEEVKRVLKPGGMIAIVGYPLMRFNDETDVPVQKFYNDTLGPYWDAERKYVDDHYNGIPFPFEEMDVPHFEMIYLWDKHQLTGYLSTWSALQHYRKKHNTDPLTGFKEELNELWKGEDKKEVVFDLITRIGFKEH